MTLRTDTVTPTSVPAISADERAGRLTDAGAAWGERIAADPAAAQLTYRVSDEGEGSVAASHVEYALGALISCQIVVYRLYALGLGIQVDDIRIDAEADLDARRLFGIDETVRDGFSDVRLTITITGPESDDHCPVLDLFANPTPVSAVVRSA